MLNKDFLKINEIPENLRLSANVKDINVVETNNEIIISENIEKINVNGDQI